MTGRDRMVIMVLGALAVLAAVFMLLVSPEKHKAAQVSAQAETARSELSSARTKLAEAQQDEKRYAEAYASIVSLGQAVPAEQEVSSLVYELDHASTNDKVNFESITAGAGGSTVSSAPATAAASAAVGGFEQLPFTFTFQGTYEELYKLMGRLQGFTVSDPSGSVKVNGRLLSIQGVSLDSSAPTGAASGGELKATVTATAYVLPAGQTLTGGASSAAPSGATQASSTGSSTGSAVATPAIVRPLP
ncbi:MAG: type II secretion system protein GspM [Solirubrobacteraceae bacterium]